jgi:hypothetical protein
MMRLSKVHPKRLVTILALTVVLCAGLVLSAQATLLDFTLGLVNLAGSSVSFNGQPNGSLKGVNIEVDQVVDKEGVLPALAIQGGVLNFTTGPLIGSHLSIPPFTPAEWDFGGGPGSFITITGAIPALNINNVNTVLLSGTFGAASVFNFAGTTFDISGGIFQDTKNPLLLDYFGIPANTPYFDGSFNLSFTVALNSPPPPGAIHSKTVGSGDVFNIPVPVPASALLLGTGLLGLVGLRRRFQKG